MKKFKVKEFVKKNEMAIVNGLIAATTFAIGYKIGFSSCEKTFIDGLEKLIITNPGLDEVLDKAVDTTREAMKL